MTTPDIGPMLDIAFKCAECGNLRTGVLCFEPLAVNRPLTIDAQMGGCLTEDGMVCDRCLGPRELV